MPETVVGREEGGRTVRGASGHKAGRGDKQAVASPLKPSFKDFFPTGPHISICLAPSSTRPAELHPQDNILIRAHNGDVVTTDNQEVAAVILSYASYQMFRMNI